MLLGQQNIHFRVDRAEVQTLIDGFDIQKTNATFDIPNVIIPRGKNHQHSVKIILKIYFIKVSIEQHILDTKTIRQLS